jgi:hypothetical protein
MLVVESLEQLYEVGDKLLPPYNFRKGADEDLATFYYFTTEDGDKYTVRFYNLGEIQKTKGTQGSYQVEFVTPGETGDTDVINKGKFFRVISTVVKVMEEFAEDKNPKSLKISPSKNFKDDERRYHIYKRYIQKLLPSDYKFKSNWFGDLIIYKPEPKRSFFRHSSMS